MAFLTTGQINNSEVLGVRPSVTFAVRIANAQSENISVRVTGFYWNKVIKTEYVLDIFTLTPGEVAERDFFAQFDAFEFQFVTSSDAVEISAWGNNAAGNLAVVYSLLTAELFPTGTEGRAAVQGKTVPSALNRIYVPNSGSNNVSVIDGKTNILRGSVIVDSAPFGVGVNPQTNRIYVANFGSNNVSVIDGNANTVITKITVGNNPVGVGVNSKTNRIYVTNRGSHNISVIDGFTNVVIATITVGAFPEGVNVNQVTNRIYITNHGSNNVSVINGSNNKVIASVDISI